MKQVFFRNLFGVLGDQDYWKSWMWIQLVLILDVYDNPVEIAPAWCPRWVSQYVTYTAFGLNRLLARVLGLRPWYEQYTPVELRLVAASPLPQAKQKDQ